MKINSIKKIQHDSARYDIQVEGNSNFFANGLLVHNSWMQAGIVPVATAEKIGGERLIVSSKGLAQRGLAFKLNDENAGNLYVRVAKIFNLEEKLRELYGDDQFVTVLGEVFGSGVQDLGYGANAGRDTDIGFRVFDIYIGYPGKGRYLDFAELGWAVNELGLELVPVLYVGPLTEDVLIDYTNGMETVSGTESHIREGVVVTPVVEHRDPKLGRVKVKSVSEAYLTRKGNTTEYQ